jgi:hypothetical protein
MREDYEPQQQQEGGYWQQPVGPPAEQSPPQAPPPYYAPPQPYQPPGYYGAPPPQYAQTQYPYPQQQYMPPPLPQAPEGPEEAEDEREDRASTVGRWVATVLSAAAIGVFVGAGIVAMLKFVNGPVSAKAIADPLEAARESSQPTPDTNIFQGKQIYLKYPSSFDQVGENRQVGGAVKYDSFMLSAKSNSQNTVALSVVPLDASSLDNDSSYRYRSMHPELYTSKQYTLGGEKAVAMTKNDKTEVTLFWPHAGMDLNLSITSTDPHVSPIDTMNKIMPTVRWVH